MKNLNDIIVREGCEFICTLPPSDKPWTLSSFGDQVIACNPDHEPVIIRNGSAEKIKITEPFLFDKTA